MENRYEYEQYHFSQELINIDKDVAAMDSQLDNAIREVRRLAEMGAKLKQHHTMYKGFWKQHNNDKFSEIMKKSRELDILLSDNF